MRRELQASPRTDGSVRAPPHTALPRAYLWNVRRWSLDGILNGDLALLLLGFGPEGSSITHLLHPIRIKDDVRILYPKLGGEDLSVDFWIGNGELSGLSLLLLVVVSRKEERIVRETSFFS